MFYLKHWSQTILNLKLKGFLWILLSMCLAFTLVFRKEWVSLWTALAPENIASPYSTLVLNQNDSEDKTLKALSSFPGVKQVRLLSANQTSKLLSPLMKELGTDYSLNNMQNYKRIKIIYSKTDSDLSYTRLNNWLKSSYSDEYTLSQVKFPDGIRTIFENPFYQNFFKLGPWGATLVLWAMWLLFFWINYNTIRAQSYLIERYQRKKLVAAKSMAIGFGILGLMITALGISFFEVDILGSIILFILISIPWCQTMKSWQWRQQF
jgi:hypothetical protein